LDRPLSGQEMGLLSELLCAGRRKTLREEWQTPTYGAGALEDDWEMFESQLRMLSDYLHDGVTLRQPLSDALDLLADDFAEAYPEGDENDLRNHLFGEHRLRANRDGYHDPRNGDLAWCIAEGKSNPIGLGLIYMLVGRRLGYAVEGVCFPGHFLCRIYLAGMPHVVDCFDEGRIHDQSLLMESDQGLTKEQRGKLAGRADLGTMLIRVLNNLVNGFQRAGREEDLDLVSEIREAMMKRHFG